MAKKAYIGVGGVARKIKKGYVGVDGVARKIKKAYIGIGGKARPFWAGGTLTYYGTATALSQVRYQLAAASNGSYALFGGGDPYENINQGDKVATVDAYSASLTRSTPTALSTARSRLAATSVGNYALFGGGWFRGKNSSSMVYRATVDAYNKSLTRSTATALSVGRDFLAATNVGNYALFAGGRGDGELFNTVDAYNTSLVKSTPAALSWETEHMGAATVGNYALFGGGASNYAVEAYNASLVKSTAADLSLPDGATGAYALAERDGVCGCSVGNYALFAGGSYEVWDSSAFTDIVDAYNASLVKSTPTALSTTRANAVGTTLGDYALLGSGTTGSSVSTSTATIEVYDKALTRSTKTLSSKRSYLAATTVDDYALFGGGIDSGLNGAGIVGTVDVFTLV